MASIFMYHAVGELNDIEGSDPHYAVSCEQFRQQLDQIDTSETLAVQLASYGTIRSHCITFDDGHLSNFTKAFPILKELQKSAEFYINTAFVGNPNYMSWDQLEEMEKAGMSIQSHGHHHEYFSDLSEQKIESELSESKRLIESKLGSNVTVFAPPGGRYDQRVIKIAKQLGYCCVATSEPGVVGGNEQFTFPRFAVIHSTNAKTIKNWCNPNSLDSIKQRLRYQLFAFAKRLLGNNNYERLRARLLGTGKS